MMMDTMSSAAAPGSTTPGPAPSSSSRFNRLINKLASTPARSSDGVLYDNDEETPLRPPVFESRFMRELEGNNYSQRPPLGASHSSPAAVTTSNSGGSIRQRLVRVASSGSLFGTAGGSPSPTSSSSQQRQSKVSPTHRKTTSLLVGSSNTPSPSPRSRGFQLSGGGHQHRHSEDVRSFTACADGPSHSPRLQPTNLLSTKDVNANSSSNTLAAGLSAHWNKSKESLLSITSNGERAGSLRLGRKRSMDGLSTFSNSIAEENTGATQDGGEDAREERPASSLSVATTNSRSSVSSSSHAHNPTTNTDRPALGARLLSSDRVPLDSSSSTSTYSKSTPGNHLRAFPAPSTAGNGNTTGLASGLSESSKRFRSAFRLNKSRTLNSAAGSAVGGDGTTPAPGTGGVRRAMRAPRRAQKEDEENNEEQEGEVEQAASMMVNQDSQSSSSATGTPEDASTSIRSDASHYRNQRVPKQASEQTTTSSPDTERPMPVAAAAASSAAYLAQNAAVAGDASVAPAYRPSMANERELQARSTQEQAQERAQLVLDRHIPLTHQSASASSSAASASHAQSDSLSTLTGSMRARRAPVQDDRSSPDVSHASAQQSISPEATAESSMLASHGLPRVNQHQRQSSRRGNQQTSLEDLMLVPSSPPQRSYTQENSKQKMPTSTSTGSLEQVDSDTLTAAGSTKSAAVSQPRRALRERDDSHDVEEILDAPSSHAGQYNADDKENIPRTAPSSPPMLGYRPKEAYSSREKLYPLSSGAQKEDRPALPEIRKPLQPQSLSSYQLPTDQPRLGAASRANKASSTSVGSSSGYHPSDRQVVVNDYAVPVKRSGDTPPDHHHYPYYAQHPPLPSHQPDSYHQQQLQQVQFPSANGGNAPRLAPPSSSLPPVPPMHQQHQQQQEQPQPVMKRTVGTVTVKGKTYTRMGLLGRGGSSKVFRVSDKDYNVFALKKVDLGKGADSETYQSFLNEISLLERLKGHDRIIQLVASEVNEMKKSLIMVMEIGEIDLNQLLLQEKVGKKQSMNFIRHTWEQMLEAVLVIHEEGIVHTDLKPANFVLVKGALKLIDFGIAKAIPNDTTNIARDQQIGTANYMSPEALSPHISNGPRGERVMKLGRPSDVWSLGCILYQIVYGHTPFGRIKNLAAKMNAIQTPGYQIDFPSHSVPCTVKGEPLPDLSTRVEEDLLKCMKACLRYEPKKRATIPELLEDRFLRRREGDEEGGDESKEAVGTDPQLVVEIIQKTLQWSNGRQVSKSEQERFMEAMLRQIHR